MLISSWVLFAVSAISAVLAVINAMLLRRQVLMLRQWEALNKILLHLCVGAFLLRQWPLRHIIQIARDDEPEPAPRRFWQRRTPKP